MSHLDPESVVSKDSNQIISRVVDDEALIIHLPSGSYYSLNAVGTRVWECLDGTLTVGDVTRIVQGEYDADASLIEAEVIALVDQLAQEGLVTVR